MPALEAGQEVVCILLEVLLTESNSLIWNDGREVPDTTIFLPVPINVQMKTFFTNVVGAVLVMIETGHRRPFCRGAPV